jgi:hypothetical protein
VSLFLNIVPFLMLLVVLFATRDGWTRHVPANPDPMLSFALLIQIVIDSSPRRARRARISA